MEVGSAPGAHGGCFAGGMSWDRAQKEAQRWVDSLNLATKSMQGQSVDLTEQAKSLKFEPKFRVMVIRAAKRLLTKRGVTPVIPED